MSTTTPQQVEPGQVWRDNDERSKGAGEFTVQSVVTGGGTANRRLSREYAIVKRESGRTTWIRVDRLLPGKAYRYIGRQR